MAWESEEIAHDDAAPLPVPMAGRAPPRRRRRPPHRAADSAHRAAERAGAVEGGVSQNDDGSSLIRRSTTSRIRFRNATMSRARSVGVRSTISLLRSPSPPADSRCDLTASSSTSATLTTSPKIRMSSILAAAPSGSSPTRRARVVAPRWSFINALSTKTSKRRAHGDGSSLPGSRATIHLTPSPSPTCTRARSSPPFRDLSLRARTSLVVTDRALSSGARPTAPRRREAVGAT